jgi:hypothetical protein
MKALYKYPQRAFPYEELLAQNAARSRNEPEFELTDTDAFAENRYFDIVAEYAKAAPDDVLVRITVTNRGPDAAPLHLLPTLWFRNTWSWGENHTERPRIQRVSDYELRATHATLGDFRFVVDPSEDGWLPFLFTENETNAERLFGAPNAGIVHEGRLSSRVDRR